MPRLIAVGDVHGCSLALRAVVAAAELGPEDRVVTLGDYVDRGPDSRGVVETLLELEADGRLVPLLGNHEEMLLSVIRGKAPVAWWLQSGGDSTLRSYGYRGDLGCVPAEHVAFFDRCLPYHEAADVFFTHAAYVADEPLPSQPAEALRWHSLRGGAPPPHQSGKLAVVGHTPQKGGDPLRLAHLVCIDTYCHGGGWLTAYEPATGRAWQADAAGCLRRGG